MKNIEKIKKSIQKNPSTAIALSIAIIVLGWILVAAITAFYKDTHGIACMGLFGSRASCVENVYFVASLVFMHPIILLAGLFLVLLFIYDLIAKKKRAKKGKN